MKIQLTIEYTSIGVSTPSVLLALRLYFFITTLWGLCSGWNWSSVAVKRRSFRLVVDKSYSIENKSRGSESNGCGSYEQKGTVMPH